MSSRPHADPERRFMDRPILSVEPNVESTIHSTLLPSNGNSFANVDNVVADNRPPRLHRPNASSASVGSNMLCD